MRYFANISLRHWLDPLRPPRRRREWIGKVLRFVGHLAPTELHDAHRVSSLFLIRDEVLGNPQGTCTHYSPHLEPRRLVGVMPAQSLDVASAPNAFARLRIVANGIIEVNVVLRFEISASGCCPVPVEGRAYLHLARRHPCSFSLSLATHWPIKVLPSQLFPSQHTLRFPLKAEKRNCRVHTSSTRGALEHRPLTALQARGGWAMPAMPTPHRPRETAPAARETRTPGTPNPRPCS